MKPCSLPPHASPIFLSGPPYLLQGIEARIAARWSKYQGLALSPRD
jgi:hypothetical protein